MPSLATVLVGLAFAGVIAWLALIEYRLWLPKPQPPAEKTESVDAWILKEWAIEEWRAEMKKHPVNSPKYRAYQDRLNSLGKDGNRHKA